MQNTLPLSHCHTYHNGPIQFNSPTSHTVCIEMNSSRQAEGRECSGGDGSGVEGREGEGLPDCLGGLSRVGISSRSTRPWNGQPPSIVLLPLKYEHAKW